MDEYATPEPLNQGKRYQPPKNVSQQHQEFLLKVGQKLKHIRESKGLSILNLSKDLNISRNKYTLIEKGKIYFNTLSLLQLLDYYQISPDNFFKEL